MCLWVALEDVTVIMLPMLNTYCTYLSYFPPDGRGDEIFSSPLTSTDKQEIRWKEPDEVWKQGDSGRGLCSTGTHRPRLAV